MTIFNLAVCITEINLTLFIFLLRTLPRSYRILLNVMIFLNFVKIIDLESLLLLFIAR